MSHFFEVFHIKIIPHLVTMVMLTLTIRGSLPHETDKLFLVNSRKHIFGRNNLRFP
jgi:hypothetical protein